MKNWRDQPSTFKLYLYSMLVIVFLLGLSFIVLVYEQLRYEAAIENREQSIRLAAELRQSSNDLARLVRTYIITGNPLYKEQFRAVVEIRDGIRPRPKNYSLAYWDLKALDTDQFGSSTTETGEAISLLDLMHQAGITDAELANLQLSKQKSDMLVTVENKAISLVEEDTPTNPLKREQALAMLADNYFTSMKSEIMRPIIATEQMIIERTQRAVNLANQRLIFVTVCLFVLGGLLLLLIIKIGQQLKRIIGCSVRELQNRIHELGKGNFLTPIHVTDTNSESVLGWLAKTQRKLAELNMEHFKSIIESSDDAIISKNMQSIVASWNLGAEKIFGYTAEEMIGQSMTIIIPPNRLHEEPAILKRIANGEKVDHFETQRLHKNGTLIDISVTISPISNQHGKVIGASKIARDITKAKTAEAEIRRLAFFDSLTGLANRRLLLDRLNQLYATAVRDKLMFAVIFLDLDNFKSLNDSKGHQAGDVLLKQTAERLVSCIRESDTAARFGGDEFVVVLQGPKVQSNPNNEWLNTVLSKIITELGTPYQFGNDYHFCTPSIGVSVFKGQQYTAEQLIKQADHAMYQAKSVGKNCYKVFGE
ncbi:PAS domain S-box-containing protein/diguanylate cyclase (GGDEF) domain-containing protein [Arsukibacterium tuosuense]|uniref:PAS domain S-box-containing protein/diguanylate cyclase (GGDEF) domain-containing protein n=1 Tax=Arsukibacterium tuosuense TaxID=1323745 RepID=A0A285IZ59_9GAMM|nr:diguanylate cyclase [Arsukibacterium tuosuense]SNY53339.1 PAS domain S-box-containing protein/diguanylate cyclase (GGDEF) domain-containing protein [Arsukibacterium tuosuense]